MTIQKFIDTYTQLPSEEVQLLKDAVAYWENNHPAQTVTINVTTSATSGGSSYTAGPPNMAITIRSGSGGIVPIAMIDGKQTYVQYDNMVGPVHELGHAILDLLGIGKSLESELQIAVFNSFHLSRGGIHTKTA